MDSNSGTMKRVSVTHNANWFIMIESSEKKLKRYKAARCKNTSILQNVGI